MGVIFDKNRGLWRARSHTENREIHLGRFKNREDAEKAVKEFRLNHPIVKPDIWSDLDRFFSSFEIDKYTGCWIWLGSLDRYGYAQFWYKGKNGRAHKFIFELHYGKLLKNEQIDHVHSRGCIYRHCVNPDHLEAVTAQENQNRSFNYRVVLSTW